MSNSYPPEFEAFWQAYPRRISKKEAFRAYSRAIHEGADHEKILAGVAAYKKWRSGSGWRPEPKHPATWLNQGCWDDEYDVVEEAPKVEFKIASEIAVKLRASGLDDHKIKRWFDDVQFIAAPDGFLLVFPSIFMRDYAKTHFDGNLRRAFGPSLSLEVRRAA